MEIKINNTRDLGGVLRAVRKHSKIRLDDLAGFAGVSKQFVSDLEHGKETVRLGLVLKVLSEIGISVKLEMSDGVRNILERMEEIEKKKLYERD